MQNDQLYQQQVKEYWIGKLSGIEDAGLIFPVSTLGSTEAAGNEYFIPEELSALLGKVSRNEASSAFLLMLAALYLSGISYANSRKMVVAVPSFEAGSDAPLFLLPASTAQMTVPGLLKQLQQELYESADRLPADGGLFREILEKNEASDNARICNMAFEYTAFNRPLTTITPAVHFRVSPAGNRLRVEALLAPGVETALVARFVRHWFFVLEKMLSAPQSQLATLFLVHPEEEQLLFTFSRTETLSPTASSINEFEERKAAAQPGETAVIYKDRSLTYNELDAYASQLAAWLVQEKNIQPGDRVGVLMRRSEWTVVVLLGILKSGAAYVPVDPAYPDHRIKYILSDSKPSIVLVEEATGFHQPGQENFYLLDQLLPQLKQQQWVHQPVNIVPEQLAYIIYTSGSTGDPKGVMIAHRNAVIFIEWALREFARTPFRLTYAVTSYCFDLSVFEIFFTLAAGKTMRVLDSSLDIPLYVNEDRNILINTVPSVIAEFVHAQTPMHNVVAINMAGEPIPFFIKEALDCSRMEVRNLYGPSEDTTYSSFSRLFTEDTEITIGRPIANTDFYILDDELRLLPLGVPGEICISGDGLSSGYLFREELTAQKFTDNPYSPGTKLYRTGDVGKWRNDGQMLYIGRKDHQVKIRGYRIELGEVETAISNCAGIKMALAVSCKDEEGKQYLAAYVTGEAASDTEAIRRQLSVVLPAYMIPSFIVPLKEFPLTPNGKIDRKALPDPSVAAQEQVQYEPPATPLEATLVEIWQDILMISRVGVLDNLFRAGGDSLKATRIMYQVYKRLNLDVTLKQIFDYPTIRQLAGLLSGSAAAGYLGIEKAAEADLYPVSPAQKSIWVVDQLNDGQLPAYNLCRTVYLDNIEPALLEEALQLLVARHESLRTNIIMVNGEPWQKIHTVESFSFPFRFSDIREKAADPAFVDALVSGEVLYPFRLDAEPLIRATLLQLTEERFLFIFNVHHIVSDGWSLELLATEVFGNYSLLKKQGNATRQPLALQYKDYVQWLYGQSANTEVHRAYWMNRFSDDIPVLNFPADNPRPLNRTFRGDTVHRLIPAALRNRMQELANREEASLFMLLLAATYITLYNYSGQEDIVIGTPVAGRDHPDLEELIGLFAHALPIRTQFSAKDSCVTLLHKVKDATLDAFAHQVYPVDKLADDLRADRAGNRNLFFDIMIVLQNADITSKEVQENMEVSMQSYAVAGEVSQIDLLVNFTEEAAGIRAEFQFNTDLYHRDRIEAMADHFNNILSSFVMATATPLCEISMMGSEEAAALTAFESGEQTAALSFNTAQLLNGAAYDWDATRFVQALLHEQATAISVTPSFLQAVINELEKSIERPPLQYTISSGETLTPALAERYYQLFPGSTLINAYNIHGYGTVAYDTVDANDTQQVTLGRPVNGIQLRVADKYLNPLPVGITGEICVRRNGEENWFRTGDAGRWTPGGRLLYIKKERYERVGNLDIDLAEIEERLLRCAGITGVSVLSSDDKLFACYYGEELPAEHIYAYLKEELPFAMLPAGYAHIAAIPLTASGRFDTSVLYKYISEETVPAMAAAPLALMEKIKNIWEEVLRTSINTDLNFFRNGGNSLSAIRMRTYIYRDMKIDVELDDIFANPTIHALSLFITRKYPEAVQSLEQEAAEEEVDYI